MGLSCRSPDSRCERFSVDNTWLKSERFLMVLGLQTYWERSTNFVCIENILIQTFDRWNLALQERPNRDKPHHLDHVRAWIYENQHLARNDRGSLWISSWHSFFKLWCRWYSFFSGVFPCLWPWGRLFLMMYSGIERRSNLYSMTPRLATIYFQEMPACAIDDAFTPAW